MRFFINLTNIAVDAFIISTLIYYGKIKSKFKIKRDQDFDTKLSDIKRQVSKLEEEEKLLRFSTRISNTSRLTDNFDRPDHL